MLVLCSELSLQRACARCPGAVAAPSVTPSLQPQPPRLPPHLSMIHQCALSLTWHPPTRSFGAPRAVAAPSVTPSLQPPAPTAASLPSDDPSVRVAARARCPTRRRSAVSHAPATTPSSHGCLFPFSFRLFTSSGSPWGLLGPRARGLGFSGDDGLRHPTTDASHAAGSGRRERPSPAARRHGPLPAWLSQTRRAHGSGVRGSPLSYVAGQAERQTSASTTPGGQGYA